MMFWLKIAWKLTVTVVTAASFVTAMVCIYHDEWDKAAVFLLFVLLVDRTS